MARILKKPAARHHYEYMYVPRTSSLFDFYCCQAVAGLADRVDAEQKRKIVECGCVSLVMAAIKRWPHTDLVSSAFGAVGKIASGASAKVKGQVIDAGAVKAIAEAMENVCEHCDSTICISREGALALNALVIS